MKYYKFNKSLHKWLGILFALVLVWLSLTGLLLLEKKRFDWIQPPTISGSEGELDQFISNQELFAVVFAENNEDFGSLADIDRVDFRPGKRVFKVRSKKHHAEIQVDAVRGKVLGTGRRNSDWIEALHDGSLLGGFFHDFVMPAVAVATLLLTLSGLYLWLAPMAKRRAAAKRKA